MSTQKSPLNTVGSTYRGFRVTKILPISEIQCTLRELVYDESGASVLHLENEDPENLFCLSFRTLPDSSNGVAHILEHTVLCGSEKYPVKDPFFAMNRRSLNTFMNALTGADFTCYPAASQVPKDFYNLLEVYLDAVFHPHIRELSFKQEGHRLEFEKAEDSSSPLEYKGIVFNEMKGALNSPTTRLSEEIHQALFPDLTYGINSGGDPKVIPSLTYEQLRDFHSTYYHPSRCLFFFYGNLPLEGHLDFLLDHKAVQVKKVDPIPHLPLQKRFSKPVYKTASFPIAADEKTDEKTMIAFAWLTCNILNQEDALALLILEIILMDTDASPLKLALLRSGLCKQVSAAIDTEMSEIPSVIVLKGCRPESADAIEKLIHDTLSTLIKDGIPSALVESALHQIEIFRSEISGDGGPYGLTLFMRSALLMQHGGNAEDGLKIHSLFDSIREHMANDPNYLSNLIRKYFLDNTHMARIVMIPSKALEEQEKADEKAKLEKIQKSLSEKEIREIIESTKQLADFQKEQEEQDIDILPKVTLEDVPKAPKDYLLKKDQAGHLQVFYHPCFTNQLVYADLIFPIPEMSKEDLTYVRIFASMISQIGCGGRDYKDTLEFMQEHTGGIGVALSMNLRVEDCHNFSPTLHIQGKSLSRNAEKFFLLIGQIASSSDFSDIPRLKEILLKQFTGMENAINSNALKYAMNLSSSTVSSSSSLANQWYGLEHYWKVRDLVQRFDEKAEEFVAKMRSLQEKLLCLSEAHLVLTCDQEMYQHLKDHHFYGLQEIAAKPFKPWKTHIVPESIVAQGRIIASPVAFTAKVFPTVSYEHPDAPLLNLAAFIFDNKTLHPKIREQGGAYGGGATHNALAGSFSFYAYRDPNISSTFGAFEEAIQQIVKGEFEDSDLEEAKLELIQGFDAPVAPGGRAETAYGWLREGKTMEKRQLFRDRVLNATCDQVKEAVKRQIVPKFDQGKYVVFAGKELLEKENALLTSNGHQPLKIEKI